MAMRYYAPFPNRDGDSYRPLPRHVLRIGDTERDAAAADLGDHYVAGRLTLDELHDRLSEVFAAATYGQLWKVMADLPGSARLRWQAWPGTLPGRPRRDDRRNDTPSDRAGRFAALSLLILAMLIWLFTAFLFAKNGYGPHTGPPTGPWMPSR